MNMLKMIGKIKEVLTWVWIVLMLEERIDRLALAKCA